MGRSPLTHIATDVEFIRALDVKLDEEVAELRDVRDARSAAEEIADIIEVLLAVAKKGGYTPEQIETIRLEKRAKRGGFEKRIILE